jgi:tetratricopeptide (TPR) repeat protein
VAAAGGRNAVRSRQRVAAVRGGRDVGGDRSEFPLDSACADVPIRPRQCRGRIQGGTGFSDRAVGSCENLVRRGDFHDAIPRLEVTIQALRDAGLLVWAVSASAMLGYAYAMTGRLREGITLLREAIEQAARGRRTHEARWTAHLCEALLRDSQVAEARELAERALGLARERGERGTEARILYLLGEIFAQSLGQDERAAAERHYVAALALAEQLGMRPLVAHCHLGLGRLYRKTSQLEQAREHLATATTMYRDMDMRFWLEQAGAELKDLK